MTDLLTRLERVYDPPIEQRTALRSMVFDYASRVTDALAKPDDDAEARIEELGELLIEGLDALATVDAAFTRPAAEA